MTEVVAGPRYVESAGSEAKQMNPRRLRPPLKWAGGKRWLVPHLGPLWHRHRQRRLVEPFCGGLAITLALDPNQALLNDINPHLINFYRWLKDRMEVEVEMRNDEDLYYQHRQRFNHLIRQGQEGSKEAAELFYYLNRTGYNGLCRFNRKGEFNVPFGRYRRIRYRQHFANYGTLFDAWQLVCGDFQNLDLERTDFIYADPPYDVEFRHYTPGGFTWDDQVRLVAWLARHPGPVILSNQATPRVVALYQQHGFTLHFLKAPRRISCKSTRPSVQEVLALRNL